MQVILLERNPVFWSCPLSNKWLIDVVDTNFLIKSYVAPAKRHGYTFIQTEITEIDRAKKRVSTAQGYLDYDWLVISAGIRYGFESWFGNDKKAIDYTRTTYPTAYIPSAEHAVVKQKIHNFKGGTFVLTLPPPPHRCPPSPYERACLMAWWYKTNKVPAKIVIEDGDIRETPHGREYIAKPSYDPATEEFMRPLFEDRYTMSFENYPVEIERLEHPSIQTCKPAN